MSAWTEAGQPDLDFEDIPIKNSTPEDQDSSRISTSFKSIRDHE